jgi:hypothetical protein
MRIQLALTLSVLAACTAPDPEVASHDENLIIVTTPCWGTIQNDKLQVNLDTSNGIGISGLYDKTRGIWLISTTTPLWEYAVNYGPGVQSNAGLIRDSCAGSLLGDSVTMAYHTPDGLLSFVVTISTPSGESAAVVTLQLKNGPAGPRSLYVRTVLPKLLNVNTPGGVNNKMGIVGTEMATPVSLAAGQWIGMPFQLNTGLPNGMNAMELADVYDVQGGGGVFVVELDGDLTSGVPPIELNASRDAILGFSTAHLKPNQTLTLPRVAIGVHGGDWHAAADYWKQKNVNAGRCSPAESWLRESGAIYNAVGLGGGGPYQQAIWARGTDGLTYHLRDRLLSVPTNPNSASWCNLENILYEAQQLGTNVIYLPDWYQGGYYNKGDYIPDDLNYGNFCAANGTSALIAGIQSVHDQGGRVIGYLESFIMSQNSQKGVAVGADWQAQRGPDFLSWTDPSCSSANYCDYNQWWCTPEHPYEGNYDFAPSYSVWQDYVVSVAKRMVCDYHMDGVDLDSMGWTFNRPEKVAKEGVSYTAQQWSEGDLHLVDRVRAAIRACRPDAVVISESGAGQLWQHEDGGLASDLANNGFPFRCENQQQLRGSVTRYSTPVNLFGGGQTVDEMNHIYAAGHNLALGRVWTDPALTSPPQTNHLHQLVATRRCYKDALVYGRQLYMPSTGDPAAQAYVYRGASQEVMTAVTSSWGTSSLNLGLSADDANSSWAEILSTPDNCSPVSLGPAIRASGTSLPIALGPTDVKTFVRLDALSPQLSFCAPVNRDTAYLNANFDDGKLDNQWTVARGQWTIAATNPGYAVFANDYFGSCSQSDGSTSSTITYDRQTGNDFTYWADVKIGYDYNGVGQAGIAFRLNDPDQNAPTQKGYYLIAHAGGFLSLVRRPYQPLITVSHPFGFNQSYRLKVVASGDTFSAYVDGVFKFSWTDPGSQKSGRFGFYNCDAQSYFDNAWAGR